MTYRRIIEGLGQTVVGSSSAAEADPRPSGNIADRAPVSCVNSSRDDSVDEEMHHYTRVQILAQLLLLSHERQGTADTSNDFSDDGMSAVIGLDFCDDMAAMIDLKPTGVGQSEMSKAGAEINEGPNLTLPGPPWDITRFPTRGPKYRWFEGEGGEEEGSRRGGRGRRVGFWVCHSCHGINNKGLCPERCAVCPHHRCLFCSTC